MSIVKNITSEDNLDWREIVINWEGMGDDVTEIKAGTPMDAEGNIANNGNCFGLMMGDVLRTRSRARVVISGPVDLDEAEANSGITLTDEAKAAMRDVWFPGKSGGCLPTGGAAYQQLVTDGEGNAKWEDRLAYGATVISWGGDTTGRVNVVGGFYKVSDLTPTKEAVVGGTFKWSFSPNRTTITQDMISGLEGIFFSVLDEPGGAALIIVSFVENYDLGWAVIPEKGIYMNASKNKYIESLIYGHAKQLDYDLLPKNYNVIFTMEANGDTGTCNCTYEELSAWLASGTPIVARSVSPSDDCATIEYLVKSSSYIRFSYVNSDGNRRRYNYNSDGRIVREVS